MSLLEIFGIIFLAVIVLNFLIGFFAIRNAVEENGMERDFIYNPAKLEVIPRH
ncbi:MAG: hypothetical protein ACM34N_14945 [Ignavibacteria bacterium]